MSHGTRLTLWTMVGTVVGLVVGVYLVTLVGIQPGDRTDLLVIAAVAATFAVASFLWARRSVR